MKIATNDLVTVTCINTVYKTLTGILANKITEYLIEKELMPREQNWFCSRSFGCKKQLLYSNALIEDCTNYGKKLARKC